MTIKKPIGEFLNYQTRFGKLQLVCEVEPRVYGTRRHRRVAVVCDCGVHKAVDAAGLKLGQIKSCGCMMAERARQASKAKAKHNCSGLNTRTVEYQSWLGMKTRCKNPNSTRYASYGGRGITLCERWDSSFETFLADMGHKPGPDYSLDRIDNDGNYEPGNCRWANNSTQNKNRRPLKHNLKRQGLI